MDSQGDYVFTSSSGSHTAKYLWEPVCRIISSANCDSIFELGCGNGAFAQLIAERGAKVVGVDPSTQGIEIARQRQISNESSMQFHEGNAYENLAERFGTFPVLVSLEVIEHVYDPRHFARTVSDLLGPGGIAIISTPYHGYLKNLALALMGKMDSHFTALWDHGHIKFWSKKTISQLFSEQDMYLTSFYRVGRFAPLAKSMICVFTKKL